MQLEQHSSGTAKTALGLGIAGTTLGVLNAGGGLLGGLFGCNGNAMCANAAGVCSDNMPVSRYEAAQSAKIAELETQVALRDANTFTDQKILEVYKDYNARFNAIEKQLAAQEVQNQRTVDSFQLTTERMHAMKKELCCCIGRERDERKCSDNILANYMNATFYPKQVADVSTGTTNTPQTVYNPLPVNQGSDCCCCDCC